MFSFAKLDSSPIDELGEGALGQVEPSVMQAKRAGIHGNPESGNHWHSHTDKSVKILSNPHTYQSHVMKTRKGGSGSKKALNYGKQGRQTTNRNVAEMQYKAHKCEPPVLCCCKSLLTALSQV